MRHLRLVLLSFLVLSACLTVAEMGRRILDGYRVWSLELVKDPSSRDLTWSNGRSAEALLRTIKLDTEADSSWFYDRPRPITGTSPEWADKRRVALDPGANYVWNDAAITDGGLQAYLQKNRSRLEEIFTFRSPDGEPYPHYRLYPEIQTGWGFSNRFGWRSSEIAVEKPPNVIRIGVIGDSTTSTYPGMVEYWLNLWALQRKLGVRFEIINAARPATGALDAAAIVDFELSAVDPDYVIVYGFGNGIYVADALIKLPRGVIKGQPASAAAARPGIVEGLSKSVSTKLEFLAHWSAAAGFLGSRVTGQRGGRLLPEPPKPATRIEFPPGINEGSPDPEKIARHEGGGVMALETYLQGLDKIDAIARARNIRLFVSTFRIMAFDGMLLGKGDPNNGGIIYSVINEGYWWPYTYAQIDRLVTFYNRTLRVWADTKGHDIIPINEQMPWQPELYGDGMHELPMGEALHAWIVLQQLMPRIRADLAQHRLPRPTRSTHPDLEQFWKIERTSVAAAIDRVATNTTHASLEASRDIPVDDVAGAFPLSKIFLAYAKAEIVPGNIPLIRTAPEPFAYAAGVPIETSAASGLTGKGWVGVRMKVNEGNISVGVLNKSAKKFLAQATIVSSPEVQEVHLQLEDLSDIGSLMISNNRPGEAARSVAELHALVLKRFRQ